MESGRAGGTGHGGSVLGEARTGGEAAKVEENGRGEAVLVAEATPHRSLEGFEFRASFVKVPWAVLFRSCKVPHL